MTFSQTIDIRFSSLNADASSASNFLMQHTSLFALALPYALTLLYSLTLLIALTLLITLTLLIVLTFLFALTFYIEYIFPLSFVQYPNRSGMRSRKSIFRIR